MHHHIGVFKTGHSQFLKKFITKPWRVGHLGHTCFCKQQRGKKLNSVHWNANATTKRSCFFCSPRELGTNSRVIPVWQGDGRTQMATMPQGMFNALRSVQNTMQAATQSMSTTKAGSLTSGWKALDNPEWSFQDHHNSCWHDRHGLLAHLPTSHHTSWTPSQVNWAKRIHQHPGKRQF